MNRRQLLRTLTKLTALSAAACLFAAAPSFAAEPPLRLGVGLFQPDKDKNNATYRPLAEFLASRLGRPVELRTVDSWE
ncbi:MAG TPA: phosphate/phosphite/phosphonate ABC transporter substrate-binding protein, partial [Rhodocyclaceae bacterium]|nr:phosphate/phosphite/phosphonate ABC transporter substrate-binding protein [Rhodocyclaceae bacterium]